MFFTKLKIFPVLSKFSIKALYYEFLSVFVPQKVQYTIEGSCIKCGKCCRYMYSLDTYTEKDFELTKKLFPKFKRFKIIGKDENENFIFSCSLISNNNLCLDYSNRLRMCKNYPYNVVKFGGELHEGCGFKISPKKSFKDYL